MRDTQEVATLVADSPNWRLGRHLYEDSGFPLDAIARELGVDVQTVMMRAKRTRWQRTGGMDEEIQARANRKALDAPLDALDPADANRASYVEIASDLAAVVLKKHRGKLDDLGHKGIRLHKELDDVLADLEEDDLTNVQRLGLLYKAALIHRTIVESAATLIELERKAWNLADSGGEKGYEELLMLASSEIPGLGQPGKPASSGAIGAPADSTNGRTLDQSGT